MRTHVRKVVAVVDDDPRILESLEALLESAGYVALLHSSASSLLAGGISNIDCLVTDVGMPGMNGFELRDRVKQARPELPVLLISGRRNLTHDGQAPDQGNSEIFRKPFDGPTLLAAIAKSLSQ
jgi:FixJ family two-component response regulator